jgi:hypothetical protein
VGFFIFDRMQVDIAAQAAVQGAWGACASTYAAPASQNCAGLSTAVTNGAQSTTLGTSVTVATGSPVEGYYCADANQALNLAKGTGIWTINATPPARPSSCSSTVASNTSPPGEYIQVTVNYTYSPIFSGISVAGLLPKTITRTAWMRLS